MQSERRSIEAGRKQLSNSAENDLQLLISDQLAKSPGFDRLFAEYHKMVYAVGLRILGSHEDAEDVTQEVFTKVWRGFNAFNRDSSLKTWIYRIAVNTSIDHGRKPWKKMGLQTTVIIGEGEEDAAVPLLISEETAEGKLLAQEKVATLSKAIGCLRPHLKDVFVLKELEEMSYNEISSVLGLSTGTISSRLNRAKKALQDSLRALTGARGFAGAAA